MNQYPIFQPNAVLPRRSRSMGVKLIVVCGLALLMSIPALFVNSLVDERTSRASAVVQDVSAHIGGQQTFFGPTLAIPYTIAPEAPSKTATRGVYLVFPAQAEATVKLTTEERRRSLFKVPVFQADARFDATFDLTGVPIDPPLASQLEWSRAEILVGVSDLRGALADATVTTANKTSNLVVTQTAQDVSLPDGGDSPQKFSFLGASIAGLHPGQPNPQFHVTAALRFSGAQRIAVLPYGKTTHISVQGNWPSPGFDGAFLPTTRTVEKSGFRAEWTVPFIARGVRSEGPDVTMTGLGAPAVGVSLIEVADAYQSVTRSLKYAPLFLGLIFLSYFIFEVTTGKRVHPAQYLLVGVAQIIFYLLLLSLSERAGFDLGFIIAGGATVTLLATNAGWVFASRTQAVRAAVVFTLLYTLIYLLLRLEDNTLLVGAVASFLAVAAAMYFTRRIDWYSSLAGSATAEQTPPVAPPPAA